MQLLAKIFTLVNKEASMSRRDLLKHELNMKYDMGHGYRTFVTMSWRQSKRFA